MSERLSEPLRMRVICDTPLGLESTTLEAKGTPGKVIVAERLVEKFAEARDWKPDECELISVVNVKTNRQMWPEDVS